jgi:hypothetical protein
LAISAGVSGRMSIMPLVVVNDSASAAAATRRRFCHRTVRRRLHAMVSVDGLPFAGSCLRIVEPIFVGLGARATGR